MRKSALSDMALRCAALLGLFAAILWMASCTMTGKQESDQQIQQQAQKATENAKIAAQKAAQEARIAAAQAARDAKDVAKGVRAGMHNGKTADGAIDVNSATRAQLESLPGISPATARHIEAHRPYGTPRDLVRKGVVSQGEYERIAPDVVTR